jgi:hypothetical protein
MTFIVSDCLLLSSREVVRDFYRYSSRLEQSTFLLGVFALSASVILAWIERHTLISLGPQNRV